MARRRVAYVLDPRFPGGTSSALAQELRAIAPILRPHVYGISSRMFSGDRIAPVLEEALDELGLDLRWDPERIAADIVIVHNPAFLKFQTEFPARIIARRLLVVTHENFLRPGGNEGFDVARCLDQLDRASLALEKTLAPISPWNRRTVTDWLAARSRGPRWRVLGQDWFNICAFERHPPNPAPRDRRGRLSRPGFEKFPPLADLEVSFPPEAERNLLLGADTLSDVAGDHPHWEIVPFRAMAVDAFFAGIDFMIYHTSPALRESFGRVLAEAIAAGKLVISDAPTAENFAGGVVSAEPSQVGAVVRGFLDDPENYRRQVEHAQAQLDRFSATRFADFFAEHVLGHKVEAP